jgi:hypothetical protein
MVILEAFLIWSGATVWLFILALLAIVLFTGWKSGRRGKN